jgi:hypothetical protein
MAADPRLSGGGRAPAGAPRANLAVPGWVQLAGVVARELPVAEIDGIWIFPKLRYEQIEYGTAIVSRVSGDRRRIYTARYALTIRGKERGKFEAGVEEVGSGPVEALASLLKEAQRRLDDEEPPTPVPVSDWFADGAPRQG